MKAKNNTIVYISVPMSGRKQEDIDRDINTAREYLIFDGYNPPNIICPVGVIDSLEKRMDNKINRGENNTGFLIGFDIAFIISSADAVAFVDGWDKSKGCRLEHSAATIYGKYKIFL